VISMTRDEWHASDDPIRLLAMLRPAVGDSSAEQRYRELACACCRRMWQKPRIATEHGPDYPDEEPDVIDALRVTEAFCAGHASRAELRRAHASVAALARLSQLGQRTGDPPR
jgi:hypothetical protein